MPKIIKLERIQSIKPGPLSVRLPDGTLTNPLPYDAVTVFLDDGTIVQIERPISPAKIQAAIAAKPKAVFDGVSEGDIV